MPELSEDDETLFNIFIQGSGILVGISELNIRFSTCDVNKLHFY
jgi:organic radical activating enzyme